MRESENKNTKRNRESDSQRDREKARATVNNLLGCHKRRANCPDIGQNNCARVMDEFKCKYLMLVFLVDHSAREQESANKHAHTHTHTHTHIYIHVHIYTCMHEHTY